MKESSKFCVIKSRDTIEAGYTLLCRSIDYFRASYICIIILFARVCGSRDINKPFAGVLDLQDVSSVQNDILSRSDNVYSLIAKYVNKS